MAATLKMTKHHWRMRQRERECSNDENAAGPAYFVIFPNVLLASPRISHRGKALAKFSLLTLRFPLLLRLARLLLGTWTWGAAA